MVIHILNWDDNFENNKSRERDVCSFVCVPNKQHGLGFTRLISLPDGLAIYGLWHCMIGLCSRQRKPRGGWLTQDGHHTGTALAPDDLAMLWRRTVPEIERAIQVLSSPQVGWIEQVQTVEDKANTAQVPAKCPPSARSVPLNRIEEKGIEEKEIESASDTRVAPPEPEKPALAQIPDQLIPAEIPSVEEVITFGSMGIAIPMEYCRNFWEYQQGHNLWLNKFNRIIDWRQILKSRWKADRATWTPDKPGKVNGKRHAEIVDTRTPEQIAKDIAQNQANAKACGVTLGPDDHW